MSDAKMEREEIIERLEYLISPDCTETQHDSIEEIEAALDLIREKEAEPKHYPAGDFCGKCDAYIKWSDKYCHECGAKIKRNRE